MAYGVFAEFYDSLTENVDYKSKAEYICKICEIFSHKPGVALDLACGTGTLTAELKKMGWDIYGVDSSGDMLTQAQLKCAEQELDILFLRQKMQSLDLYGTINTCVCTLDSINHLDGEAQVQKAFDRVGLFTEKDGLFIFDVNTVYKHRHILADNTFVFDTDNVYCVWQNRYNDTDNSVEMELDFFIPENGVYIRNSEYIKEYAYTKEKIAQMLDNSGFEVLAVYDDMTFDSPKEGSQRLTFAAKKKYDSE